MKALHFFKLTTGNNHQYYNIRQRLHWFSDMIFDFLNFEIWHAYVEAETISVVLVDCLFCLRLMIGLCLAWKTSCCHSCRALCPSERRTHGRGAAWWSPCLCNWLSSAHSGSTVLWGPEVAVPGRVHSQLHIVYSLRCVPCRVPWPTQFT